MTRVERPSSIPIYITPRKVVIGAFVTILVILVGTCLYVHSVDPQVSAAVRHWVRNSFDAVFH